MVDNYNGTLLCTASSDHTLKLFDVVNFGNFRKMLVNFFIIAHII